MGILKIKALLIGLLLASPPVAAWILRGAEPAAVTPAVQPAVSHTMVASPADGSIRIPVEVVAEGSAPQWLYVEVQSQAVPEPGVMSLVALTSLLLLRRHRKKDN